MVLPTRTNMRVDNKSIAQEARSGLSQMTHLSATESFAMVEHVVREACVVLSRSCVGAGCIHVSRCRSV